MPKVHLVETNAELKLCFPVMHELRKHLTFDSFVERVNSQMSDGYMLAYVKNSNLCVAVAGFRIGSNLSVGKYLYVDDLVTTSNHRSKGFGDFLLAWLVDYAKSQACQYFHLDSGVQRKEAHHFHERTGLAVTGLHFGKKL